MEQGGEGLYRTKASSCAKGWEEKMLERGLWRKEPSIGEGRRGQQGLAWGRTHGGKEDRGTAVCFLNSQPAWLFKFALVKCGIPGRNRRREDFTLRVGMRVRQVLGLSPLAYQRLILRHP